jgi:prophage tail gpP-like protein
VTITVKNLYNPTADVAAALAASASAAAVTAARSAVAAGLFATDAPNQFRLVIDGTPIQEVKSATLLLSCDAGADGFTAVVPYFKDLPSPLNRDDLLSPPAYPTAEIYLGGVKMFTGRLYQRKPKFSKSGCYRTLIGWSPIADAIDSAVTPPLEANNVTLQVHAMALLAPFGLTVTWLGGTDLPFTRATPKREDTVFEHLARLAKQRGLLIMSGSNGEVVFQQIATGEPVAFFEEGVPPFDEAEIDLDGRKWFGQYVCYTKAPRGNKQATAVDDRFPIARRTIVNAPDGSDADMKTTAEWEARKRFADGIAFQHQVPSWWTNATPLGVLWEPNQLVRVTSPTMFLPNGFDFLTRSVEYRFDAGEGTRATLDLVSPTAFQTLEVQKKNGLSWKARMMLAKSIATPLEKTLMDTADE